MRSRLLLALLVVAILPTFAVALDTATRPIGSIHTWTAADLERFDPSWIQVKFVEGSNVLFDGANFVDDSGLDMTSVQQTTRRAGIAQVRSTIQRDRATLRAWKALGEQRSGVVGPDLSLWYDVRVEGGRAAVARLVNELNALPEVEIAHPVPIAEPAVVMDPGASTPARATATTTEALLPTPDFSAQQVYLFNPPAGLNAPAAWAIPGGYGDGMKFIDVELCWTENHEDFDVSANYYIGGATQDPSYETHGTAVLGEVIGQHNGFGVMGFAPNVDWGVVAVTVAEWPTVPHYFQEAVDHLDAGDAWLIELQMYPPGKSATPMEWLQVNYDVIWTSCWALAINCIEAGANGSQNLDDASWGGVFNRLIRDSGATMVGAGTPYGLVAEGFSNYGSRMDVHAWGSSIVTTGYGDLYGTTLQNRYTSGFGGTSGASPMVTGSALALEGIARANIGRVLTPLEVRTILHDTGTPHSGARYIGPRPNLAPAAARVLEIADAPESALDPAWATLVYPNPFRSNAEIRLSLPSSGAASFVIFDAAGRKVRTLLDGATTSAPVLRWDGLDDAGRAVGSGVYFYRLSTPTGLHGGRIDKIR